VRWRVGQHVLLDEGGRHPQYVHVADGAQALPQPQVGALADMLNDFLQTEDVPGGRVTQGPFTMVETLADAREARANDDQPVEIGPLLGDHRLLSQLMRR